MYAIHHSQYQTAALNGDRYSEYVYRFIDVAQHWPDGFCLIEVRCEGWSLVPDTPHACLLLSCMNKLGDERLGQLGAAIVFQHNPDARIS